MQHVKNAIGGNAMKMLKMHQNALKCTRMRMGKINTTFGKKQHLSRHRGGSREMHLVEENLHTPWGCDQDHKWSR